jgi:hypothetical protein
MSHSSTVPRCSSGTDAGEPTLVGRAHPRLGQPVRQAELVQRAPPAGGGALAGAGQGRRRLRPAGPSHLDLIPLAGPTPPPPITTYWRRPKPLSGMTPCLPCSSDRSVSSGQARAARSGSLASSRSSPRRLGGSLCHWRVLIRGLRPRRRVMSSHAIVAVANSTSAAPATLNHPLALRPEPNAACSPDRGSISAFPTRSIADE